MIDCLRLVDSMLCTLNTTAEVSSIDRSHQEDMQSFATVNCVFTLFFKV